MFIGRCRRRSKNPACISALAARAAARAWFELGHSFFAGNCSCRYSPMASDSQITVLPCFKRRDPARGRMAHDLGSGCRAGASGIITSWKVTPARFSINQARSDQEE